MSTKASIEGSPSGSKRHCGNPACKKVFSRFDPHSVCSVCTPRTCSKGKPCKECKKCSSKDWKAWDDYVRKSESEKTRRLSESTLAQEEKEAGKANPSPTQVGNLSVTSDSGRLDSLETNVSGIQSTLELLLSTLQRKSTPPPPGGVVTTASLHGQQAGHAPIQAGQLSGQSNLPIPNIPLPLANPLAQEVAPCPTLQPG